MGVKAAGAYGWQLYHLQVPTVLKSGILKLLEASGIVQACNGFALPSTATYQHLYYKTPSGIYDAVLLSYICCL